MDDDELDQRPTVLHDWNILPDKKVPFCAPDAARLTKKQPIQTGPGPITWTVSDLAKAGCLLCLPPKHVTFSDEQEMRRVYTLIYDVYRYKNILNQALMDVMFFYEHRNLSESSSRVWLLLYDLYHRSFKKRTVKNAAIAQSLFPDCELQEVEDTLWEEKVKLAAAIARLRIKSSALRLSQLLPHHLRDERTGGHSTTPVTCWVNIKKIKNSMDLCGTIEKSLGVKLIEEASLLESDTFKWDLHCPQFIIFHPSARTKVAQSNLVKKHKLIVQDRSFCLGPATFKKIITDLQLRGTVIQSHVNSPRTTAYLASILSQNENIKKLLAFSAGNRKVEYESYFNDLGIKNILIFSEKLIDVPPDSTSLEEVIAVFATPPNSYSAVTDPIDLVCSRGGDLSMLEVLTETEDTLEGRKRVASILEEQKRTLKFAMSRPQIQFVLYETHSEIDAENDQMVQKTVSEINKCAQIHHATLQGKLKQIQATEELEEKEINNNDLEIKTLLDFSSETNHDQIENVLNLDRKTKLHLNDITVPETDLFDVPDLPSFCSNMNTCIQLSNEGCFLALLQRKHVTRMDNKYMIEMAETRGLFGAETQKNKKSKQSKKKVETAITTPVKKKKQKDIEIDRIAAPTMSSTRHSRLSHLNDCPKMYDDYKSTESRRWWNEATRHIINVRSSLSKQKLLPPIESGGSISSVKSNAKRFVNSLVRQTQRVDEIVAKGMKQSSKIPLYPKLRLSRIVNKYDNKVQVPIHVTVVTFPSPSYPVAFKSW